MSSSADLGKLISTHSTSPVFIQRAAIVALASFAFFLLMLAAFYARPQIGYFVLATAFLLIDLFTLIGIWLQKRNVVKLHANGIAYKSFRAAWNEIDSVKADSSGMKLVAAKAATTVPASIDGYDTIVRTVREAIEASNV